MLMVTFYNAKIYLHYSMPHLCSCELIQYDITDSDLFYYKVFLVFIVLRQGNAKHVCQTMPTWYDLMGSLVSSAFGCFGYSLFC